jgi:copper homeostasis protein
VDDVLGLAEAVAGGADRVELCAALGLGGLTPAPGLMEVAVGCGVPVMAMIRPRAGDFVYGAAEVAVMKADIAAARRAGLAGVVLGASLRDGRLDEAVLRELVAEAGGLDLTLHRAVDLAPDAAEAVEVAARLGFRRVLSSGGARVAAEGTGRLAEMIAAARGRLEVMPGSGVSVESWPALAGLGVREVHASCAVAVPGAADRFGFVSGTERRTDRGRVAALKAVLG